MLTFAIPKGRMLDETLSLLKRTRVNVPDYDPANRRLIFHDADERYQFVVVKPYDVPTYVEYGAADVGVAGKDVIEETDANVYEPLDLGFSQCRLSVARPEDLDPDESGDQYPRVATEFTNLAERHFSRKGENVELIQLHGSVELAPLIGLCQRIVDIVSTGQTLQENGLVEEETILHSSARLIVNRPAMKLHRGQISRLLEELEGVKHDAPAM